MMTDNPSQSASLIDMVGRGIAMLEGGDLLQARQIFDAVLADNPRHFDALHFNGIVATQSGDYVRAQTSAQKLMTIYSGNKFTISQAQTNG